MNLLKKTLAVVFFSGLLVGSVQSELIIADG